MLWLAVALLLCLTPINDQDLGFHIAWGRILQHDFAGARGLLLGQDPSVTVYAYAYWLYQVIVATLFDHGGPWAIVLFRTALVMGSFGLAFRVASRLGSSRWSRAWLLAFGIAAASERFVDRPDVFSHLAWMAGLWILLLHRRDRGVWMLLPLQVVWVNMHHHFTLLPAAYAAFVIGDFLETGGRGTGRPRGDPADWPRAGLVFGSVLLATCLNPMGPAAWLSQLKLAGVFTGRVSPIPLQEIISPYAAYAPFLALWIFRIGMPLCLAAAILGRKRIGLGALLALLIPAVLAILARRALCGYSGLAPSQNHRGAG